MAENAEDQNVIPPERFNEIKADIKKAKDEGRTGEALGSQAYLDGLDKH